MGTLDRIPARRYEYIDTAGAGDSLRAVAAAETAGLFLQRPAGSPPATATSPDDIEADQLRSRVEELLQPENRGRLIAILAYHVVTSHALATKRR